jgi:hypothetical protein
MDISAGSRWAPLTGILAPVLWFAGVTVSESGDVPGENATAEDVLAFFQAETGSILLGGVLFMFGTLAFVLFVSVLRGRWRTAGGPPDASALAFATGIVGGAFIAATWAPQLGLGIAIEDMGAQVQPATAEAAWHLGTGFFVLGELFLGLFLFATAAVSMKVPIIPAWLAWIGVAFGVVALIPPIGWAVVIFGLPVWLIAAAVVMMVKRPAGTATTG